MIFARPVLFLLSGVFIGEIAAVPRSRYLSHDSGMQLARLLQEDNDALEGLPDICSGFELMIDQIPNGRDSCTCDGVQINCLFEADCPAGSEEKGCGDVVTYQISFEDQLIVASCATVEEGGFEETCTTVSLGPDLLLEECVSSTYAEQPCDCEVCEGRDSINIDCSAYNPLAVTACQAIGLGGDPMVPTFEEGNEPAEGSTSTPQPQENSTPPEAEEQEPTNEETVTAGASTSSPESGAILNAVTTAACALAMLSVVILL